MVVITDNDMPKAERMAKKLGMELFSCVQGPRRHRWNELDCLGRGWAVAVAGCQPSHAVPCRALPCPGGPVLRPAAVAVR